MFVLSRWLVEKRGIIGLGIDTPSTDFGQSRFIGSVETLFLPLPFWSSSISREFLTHQILGASNVWGDENLAR